MVQNSKFTVQLLEKIGAPLATAIESVSLQGEDQDVKAAKLMAQLLGQAVQISISLNGSFNVVEEEAQADSTRLALAALAAPLLADFYQQNERVPEDQDIKRIIKSLESVVAFADNFSAAEEGKSRLATIDQDAPLFDKTQSALVVMQAMIPVMSVVAEFSFGQSEAKLMQDITAKLEGHAADIAKNSNLSDKLSELMVLKALAGLYAECHRGETQKLASAPSESHEGRGELSLDPVWDAFSTRVAMIEAVMGFESKEVASAGATAPAAPVAEVAKPAEAPATPAPIAAPSVVPAEPTPATPPSSPMGFFKKPDENAVPVEAASTAPVPPTPEAPVAPQPVESVAAPVTAPETIVPNASAEQPSSPPSSPMGFFKPGAKKVEDGAGE